MTIWLWPDSQNLNDHQTVILGTRLRRTSRKHTANRDMHVQNILTLLPGGGRDTGEWYIVPKTGRMLLLGVALDMVVVFI